MSEGRTIETAYVELRPKVAEGFEQESESELHPLAAKVGAKFGSALGKTVGLALKPEVTAAVGSVGTLLQGLADKQKEATEKLTAAIESSGGVIGTYKQRIDALDTSNQKLGISSATTNDRLAELTLALGSPKEAVEKLGLAQDIAAGTGRSLSSTFELLKRTRDGDVAAYEQLGLKVRDLGKAQDALKHAQADSASAAGKVASAQENYNNKLEIYRQTVKPTLAQQIALKESHDKLVTAQHQSAEAAAKAAHAQDAVKAATKDNEKAQDSLAKKYQGQAAAGADTFLGKLKALRVELTDGVGEKVAQAGEKFGQVGIALLGVSTITKTVQAAFIGMRTTIVATEGEATAAVVAGSAAQSGALTGLAAAAARTVGALGLVLAAGYGLQQLVERSGLADQLTQSTDFKDLPGFVQNQVKQLAGEQQKAVDDYYANLPGNPDAAKNKLQDQLNSDDPRVAARARAQIDAAKKAAAATGKAAGDQTLQSFLDSINGGAQANAAQDALAAKIRAGRQAAVDAAQQAADAAASKLQQDLAARLSLQNQIASTAAGGSSLADAFHANGSGIHNEFGDQAPGGGGIKSVEAFLHSRAVKIARFARALSDLRKKGLDARLVAEIAGLGTDEGLDIAQQLLASGSADIASINLSEQQIDRAAQAVGANIANSQFGDVIAADRQNTAVLASKLDAAVTQLKRINGTPTTVQAHVTRTGASAAEIGGTVGREVAIAIRGTG